MPQTRGFFQIRRISLSCFEILLLCLSINGLIRHPTSILDSSAINHRSLFASTDLIPETVTEASECISVDLVIGLDQSKSMMPTDITRSPSDADDFRSEATQLLVIELLINQLLECPEVRHRWSVVEFGSGNYGMRIAQEMTAIPPIENDPIDADAVRAFLAGVQDAIPIVTEDDEPDQTGRSLGGTDFRIPFSEAISQLSFPRTGTEANLPMKRALVIITDGSPCVIDSSQDYSCDPDISPPMPTSDLTRYMEELYGMWQEEFEVETEIYLIPINTAAAGNNYLSYRTDSNEYPTLNDFWEAITGGKIFAVDLTGRTVTKAVTDVSRDLLGRGEVFDLECQGNQGVFFMPPFQEQAEIIVLKDEYEDVFSLSYSLPDGGTVMIQDGQIVEPENRSGETIRFLNLGRSEIYRFIPPVPGQWSFAATDCERMFVRFTPIYIEPSAVAPSGTLNTFPDSPYYDDRQPLLYQVDLKGQQPEAVLQSLVSYPITITLSVWHEVEETAEEAREIQLYQVDKTTLFESRPDDYVTTRWPGNYNVRIQGTFLSGSIQNPSELAEYTIFDDVQYTFAAKELTSFSVALINPSDGDIWQLNEVASDEDLGLALGVEIALIDPNDVGSDFPYDNASITPVFTVTLQQEGNPNPVTVEVIPLSRNGHFIGEITPQMVERRPNEELGFILTAEFAGNYDDKTYYLLEGSQQATFTGYAISGISQLLHPIESSNIHTSFLAACPIISDWKIVQNRFEESAISQVQVAAAFEARRNGQMQPMSNAELAFLLDGNPVEGAMVGQLFWTNEEGVEEKLLDNLRFIREGENFILAEPLTELTVPGTYRFEVSFAPGGELSKFFQIIQGADSQTFRRIDTTWTNPATCGWVMSISGGTLTMLLLLFVVLITGPMTGILTIRSSDGELTSLYLPKFGWIRRFKDRTFENNRHLVALGIGKVKVTIGKSDLDDEVQVFKVETFDVEQAVIDYVEVHKGSPKAGLFGDSTLEYRE